MQGRPELTPVAIRAGKLLADRLYAGKAKRMNYVTVPTTVFTPLEYGCVGYSEEDAIALFGEESVEVFHTATTPLEWRLPHLPENACYLKLVCLVADGRVLGFHIAAPNAGEIVQAVAVAVNAGATKQDFDDTLGIHPTVAEALTDLVVTKSSGAAAEQGGC